MKKETGSQEIHDGIQGLESYAAIPEYDDMIISYLNKC